jgi:hypothetical protein
LCALLSCVPRQPPAGEALEAYLLDPHGLWRKYLANPSAGEAHAIVRNVQCIMKKIVSRFREIDGYLDPDSTSDYARVVSSTWVDGCPEIFIQYGPSILRTQQSVESSLSRLRMNLTQIGGLYWMIEKATGGKIDTQILSADELPLVHAITSLLGELAPVRIYPDTGFETLLREVVSRYPVSQHYIDETVLDRRSWKYMARRTVLETMGLMPHAGTSVTPRPHVHTLDE